MATILKSWIEKTKEGFLFQNLKVEDNKVHLDISILEKV